MNKLINNILDAIKHLRFQKKYLGSRVLAHGHNVDAIQLLQLALASAQETRDLLYEAKTACEQVGDFGGGDCEVDRELGLKIEAFLEGPL